MAMKSYHHGNLAESLLQAVDEIATKFGFEAVTLRGCAKLLGVSPSAAFRHYVDKRALLTAFATRALLQLSDLLEEADAQAQKSNDNAFKVVGLAYLRFALEKPALYRAMWHREAIYSNNEDYVQAADKLSGHLKSGFANTIEDRDPKSFSSEELLAWSSLHGLAGLFNDGPIDKNASQRQKMETATKMIERLSQTLGIRDNTQPSGISERL